MQFHVPPVFQETTENTTVDPAIYHRPLVPVILIAKDRWWVYFNVKGFISVTNMAMNNIGGARRQVSLNNVLWTHHNNLIIL